MFSPSLHSHYRNFPTTMASADFSLFVVTTADEPPVRPPQLRCVFFPSMHLPHLLVLPATFWTSVPFATLSAFPSLICGSCPSGQRFAYSFFQIPSHGGHPCCSAMCFVVAYAHLGLSPIRIRPCWANKKAEKLSSLTLFPLLYELFFNFICYIRPLITDK